MRRLKERSNKDNYKKSQIEIILDSLAMYGSLTGMKYNENKKDFIYRKDPVGMAKEGSHSKYIK